VSVHNRVADLPSMQIIKSSRDSGIGRIMDQIIGNDDAFRIWRDTAHRLLILAIKRDNFVPF
jgi:hypothetical protein